jgi:hypothetical protein
MDDARRRPARRRRTVWLAAGLVGALALPVAAGLPSTDPPAAKDAASRPVPHHDLDAARREAAHRRAVLRNEADAAQRGAARREAVPRGAAESGAKTGGAALGAALPGVAQLRAVGSPAVHSRPVPSGALQSRAAWIGVVPIGAAATETAPQAAPGPSAPAVRLAPREPGAPPNDPPARLAPAALRAALQRVTVQAGAEPGPLFGARELDVLVGPLADALTRATPEQDVVFAIDVDGHAATAPGRVTSARLFRRDGQLELIVGRARQARQALQARDASGEPNADPHELRPGRRAVPVDPALRLVVAPGGGSLKRGDWVSLRPGPTGPRTTAEPAIAPQGRRLRASAAGG